MKYVTLRIHKQKYFIIACKSACCVIFFLNKTYRTFFLKIKQCIPLSYSRSTLYWKLVTIQSNWVLLKVNCIISMTKWCNISGIKYKLANFSPLALQVCFYQIALFDDLLEKEKLCIFWAFYDLLPFCWCLKWNCHIV